MSFTGTHLYITVHWNLPGGEFGQTGLRVNQSTYPGAIAFGAVQDAWEDFWEAPGAAIPPDHQLTMIKMALIDASGHYPPSEEAQAISYVPVVSGGGSIPPAYPDQVSAVASLRTDIPRGPGSKGRMYLPPISLALDGSRLWTATQAGNRGAAVATLISQINAALSGDVCVMSSVGSGTTAPVTVVRQGNRPDVQRRRAKQQVETYSTNAVP